jgi:ABC-2 type transport system permease protein
MNIFKQEFRTNFKAFAFWMIGLAVLVFAGITKATGFVGAEATVDINALLGQFPRVILAMFGMVGVDINTIGGYYAVLVFYILICASIYGISLGVNAVSRESFDGTYEFIFTKPRTRSYILRMKLLAAYLNLILFCMFSVVFSFAAINVLDLQGNLNTQIVLFGITVLLSATVFFALAVMFSALSHKAERGAKFANLCFVFAFIVGVISDMTEKEIVALKVLSPLKYFAPADVLDKTIDPVFAGLCLALSAVFLFVGFRAFRRKDLNAT